MSARRRCSHFFLFPFFFFLLFLDFLRPPGITGLIAGGLVGDGFGAEASVVVAAADGASAAGAGASAAVVASTLVSDGFGGAEAVAVAHRALQSGVGRRRPRALLAVRATHCDGLARDRSIATSAGEVVNFLTDARRLLAVEKQERKLN